MPRESFTSLRSFDNYTLLIYAVNSRRLEIIKYLIKLGVDVNECVKSAKETALTRSIFVNDPAIVVELLEAGADKEHISGHTRFTPLIEAVMRNRA
mmetsp:Transcript_6452/g.4577  ORF Transcript_6452/g.4577 Transcript_6452/m.4577 type:complete len:96 (+) Transcript_6452:274-561(+)